MRKIILQFFVAIFVSLALGVCVGSAQNRTDVYAITNARIVIVSGAPIERGTVVVRDGLIEAVGANARVPADAQVINGDGLTIYPGFFDADTNLGLPAQTTPSPAQSPFQRGAIPQASPAPASNSNYPNGLQPEEKVVSQLQAGDAQFDAQRSVGMTTALTIGRDGIFNGQSALINLSGNSVSEMLIREPVAEHITFRTLGVTYPTSLLGTFSALRQMFLDAQRLQINQQTYAKNPRGMPRPEADESLEALIPILNRQMPVVFNANSEREIVRALDLAQEFNLTAIIAGGQEAWKQAARLKKQNVPVLLSLNFPRRTTSASPEADPETLAILRFRVETPKGAARLQQAGVKFAFESGGATNPNDFLTNAGKAVENGLSPDDALRAMTLSAAEIFGVSDRLGTIETGKIANLVVSRGDVLSKDKTIKYVFVDGKLFEQKEKPKTPTPPAGTTQSGFANVSGTYKITIEVSGQAIPATLTLIGQGRILSGSLQSQFGTSQIDGEVSAEGFKFNSSIDFAGRKSELVVNGNVNGNQISGTFTTQQGTAQFTGTRVP
ncbi:MAG: amidohydrolase family protein [Pyrinomonadaceae bacterium]